MANRNQAHKSCVRRNPAVIPLNSGFARPEVTDVEIWIENGSLSETKSRQQIPAYDGAITGFAFSSAEPCLTAIVVRNSEIDVGVVDIRNSSIQAERQIVLCKSTNVDLYFRNTELESKDEIVIENKITDDRMFFSRRALGPEMYGIQATFEDIRITATF